jgi:ATP-dependent protease ClpP protease subunit
MDNGLEPSIRADPLLHSVLDDVEAADGETERFRADRILRKKELFEELEADNRRLICYFGNLGGIDLADAAPIGSMLDAIGDTEKLDLMLNSPGGWGEAVEKLVHLCRSHCSEFRVIVPNWAKSAATLMALGADEIIMGYLSELGPIDPQYEIAIGQVTQQLSGHVFIHAFEETKKKVDEALSRGESPVVHLQALQASTMEPAFIEHCRRGVDLSRDIATKFLMEYQLPAKGRSADDPIEDGELTKAARAAAEDLLSENRRFSHGRLIGPTEARDEVGLNVRLLERDDPQWLAYWELYVRADVYAQNVSRQVPVTKLFVDRDSTLPAYGA